MEVKEYSLKLSTEQAQVNVDELNKSLVLQEDLIEEIETELRSYEKQLEKTSKRDLAARKNINDKIKQTKTRLDEEKAGLKSVTKDRKRANESMKEAEENAADYGGVLGMIDSKTGGLISGFSGMTKSVGGATKGFNLMKVAIIGTGIGALLIAILAVSKAFTSSEAGQNKFAKIMAVIGSVTGNLVTMLSDLGELIIGVFENPKQAILDLKDLIVENITNRITSLIDTLGFLGSAIKKVFSGDFTGALDDAKSAGSSYVDSLTGVKDTINKVGEAVSNLATELVEEGKIAANIADQRAKADKLDRKLTVERAEANRKRAELLDKAAQKETFTAKERIAFLTEAGEIEDEITAKEIEAAQLRYDAKVAENALANSTKEDLVEEANLRANLINLETAKLSKQKAVSAQILGATREEAAEKKAAAAEEIADAKAVQDFKDSLRVKDKNNKFAEIELEKEARLKALEALKLSKEEEEQMKIDVEQAFKEKKKIIEDEEQVLIDEQKAAFLETQLQKEELALEDQRAKALDELKRLGGTLEDKKKINDKYDKIKIQDDKIKRDAEINMAKNTFAGIANLLGQNSKAGKAAAVAAALINTYQGITAELATKTVTPFGFALKLVNIASTAAIGFKAVKSIMATKPTEGGGGSVSNPGAGVGTPRMESIPPIPPEFNTVGASDTNQLASAIGQQDQQPIKAFVVSNDVTTAQGLERNIVSGATL
jgi:hypothetical protein|tara:strand:- start:1585 stop:3735 length:2151 start_codon:yes stop_codon:yes gene_type:complete